MSVRIKVALIIILVLIADQVLKIVIKTNMYLGESNHVIGNWFILHFIENNGMAFGMEFGGNWGKIALTIFRIIAVTILLVFINRLIKREAPIGFILALGLITAGAAGNIFDSIFYGLIFNESSGPMIQGTGVASLFPEGGGYGKLFQGKVVDMFYFPIIRGQYPDWFPFKAGQSFLFFRPVFNVADSAITCGVAWVLIFQRKFLRTL